MFASREPSLYRKPSIRGLLCKPCERDWACREKEAKLGNLLGCCLKTKRPLQVLNFHLGSRRQETFRRRACNLGAPRVDEEASWEGGSASRGRGRVGKRSRPYFLLLDGRCLQAGGAGGGPDSPVLSQAGHKREGSGGSCRRLATAAHFHTDDPDGPSHPRLPWSRLGRGWGTPRAGSRAGAPGCCRPRREEFLCRIRESWKSDSRWCW